eukprot:TRINITY_DN5378_c0_g1_i1.p1 TRINITY_DN5378_c0_g1~~TRINITY_DN5378_c0_g1_i1.p1  ORF type:complete len:277 (+),score=32.69 TRINITY_DN5378_c0_g1_i1:23-853(+)
MVLAKSSSALCQIWSIYTALYFWYWVGSLGQITPLRSIFPSLNVSDDASTSWISNLTLFGLFVLQSIIFSSTTLQTIINRNLPSFFALDSQNLAVLFSNSFVITMIGQWKNDSSIIWDLSGPFSKFLQISSLFLLCLALAFLLLPGVLAEPLEFKTDGLYALFPHPFQLVLVLASWCTPKMTCGQLTWAIVFTIYVILNTEFEFHEMVSIHGDAYLKYRRHAFWVPQLFTPEYTLTFFSMFLAGLIFLVVSVQGGYMDFVIVPMKDILNITKLQQQ